MKREKCGLCKLNLDIVDKYADSDSNICVKCQLSVYQVLDILEMYITGDVPPKWIMNMVKEFAWIYQKNPRTMGYFNTVLEVVEEFLFEEVPRLSIDEIRELAASAVPDNKILKLLTEAMVIKVEDGYVYPGILVEKLQKIRWEGYTLSSRQLENKFLELHGIITIAITRSMIKNQEQVPRQVLSLFTLLSNQILLSGDDEIEPIISSYSFDGTVNIFLQGRQCQKMKRQLAGFADGRTKIIEDIDDEGELHLKDSTITYLTEMRMRWRERERDRIRV